VKVILIAVFNLNIRLCAINGDTILSNGSQFCTSQCNAAMALSVAGPLNVEIIGCKFSPLERAR
jgi:hypothetical protein